MTWKRWAPAISTAPTPTPPRGESRRARRYWQHDHDCVPRRTARFHGEVGGRLLRRSRIAAGRLGTSECVAGSIWMIHSSSGSVSSSSRSGGFWEYSPSQYRSPSTSTAGNRLGTAADARTRPRASPAANRRLYEGGRVVIHEGAGRVKRG